MTYCYIKGQALLIVVGEYKSASLILHAEGVGAAGEMDYSPFLADHFYEEEIPKQSGFYMWEGGMGIDDGRSSMGEPSDPDVRWDGAFRKAQPHEVLAWIRKHHQKSP